MKYNQVKNCRYSNQEHTAIDCEVLFESLGWVSFTASLNDIGYSVEIYKRAKNGEFGEVKSYEPIVINTITITPENIIRQKRDILLSNLDTTICNPLRWQSFSDEEKENFARYRQLLLDIPQQPEFPTNVVWPDPPTNLREPEPSTLSLIT